MAAFSSGLKRFWAMSRGPLGILVQVVGLNHLLTKYGGDVTQIIGPSMLPTINRSGDLVLYETSSVRRDKLKKGNIVILRSPRDPDQVLCKRIIAMEGEEVELESRYSPGHYKKQFVPKGHVWIQGDNLSNSSDSRTYGSVPRALIIGRAFARIFPLSQAKWLDDTLEFAHTPTFREAKEAARLRAEERHRKQLKRVEEQTSSIISSPPPPPLTENTVVEDIPMQRRTLPGVTIIRQQTKDSMSTVQDDIVAATTTRNGDDGASRKIEFASGSDSGATSCFAELTVDEYSMTLLSGYFGLGASRFPPAYECLNAAEKKSSSI